MHNMHETDIDLNLLRLFSSIYRTRSVTRAAEELGMAQPAASQGLARLRKSMGDALFARSHGGVEPTAFAERLAPKVEAALGALTQALQESRHFDPQTSDRRFMLHLSDIGESRVLPDLISCLRAEARHVQLESRYLPTDEVAEALDAGRIDFAIGVLPNLRGVKAQVLTVDAYRLVMSQGHPMAGQFQHEPLSVQDMARMNFVSVSTHAETTQLLRLLGLEAQLKLTIQHFTALPAIVRDSDLVAIVPNAITGVFEGRDFTFPKVEFPTPPFNIYLYWSHRSESDAGAQWLKALILRNVR